MTPHRKRTQPWSGLLITTLVVLVLSLHGGLTATGGPPNDPPVNQPADQAVSTESPVIRLGIIGLDTSHAVAFTKLLNDPQAPKSLQGCRVVAAYPPGSPDIESSVRRVAGYTQQVRELGVEIVDSLASLLDKVDGVLLETNDGRPHLEQARPVLAAGKPLFIDKPFAGSLRDVVTIAREARAADVPIFSSSSLRFTPAVQRVRGGSIGPVTGCDAYSPCSLEPTHPDLYWYGIHGVELLFTAMGPGCREVTRVHSDTTDVVVGKWTDGRIGTFRGIRAGKGGYGGTAFGERAIAPLGPYTGYRPLVEQIVTFFKTSKPPVSMDETIEIYAFMEAADESKRQGGVAVSVKSVLNRARGTDE